MSYQYQCIDDTPIHFPLGELVYVGCSYVGHAKELNSPVPTELLLFIKPNSCMIPVDGGLGLPQEHDSVHYEVEIAMLIGKPLSHRPNRERAPDAVSGYAPALDLTLREVQAKLKEKGLPRELARSFDDAGVLPPFVNADQPLDPTDISIRLTINGEMRQDDDSRDTLNPIVPLIQHVAGHFSLQADDMVLAGTPSGVRPLNSGDKLPFESPGVSRFEARTF